MKQSEFNYLIKQDNFKAGFRGALSLLIAEIVDANTAENVDITTIDYFEFKRREFAYSMKGANGSFDRYLSDLRSLFPKKESESSYYPFTVIEPTVENKLQSIQFDIDDVADVLF